MDSVISNKGKIVQSLLTGYWIDIGHQADYNKAKEIVKHINK